MSEGWVTHDVRIACSPTSRQTKAHANISNCSLPLNAATEENFTEAVHFGYNFRSRGIFDTRFVKKYISEKSIYNNKK